MAITFRDLKGSALSHQEMDTNLASYYLSSSVSGSTITFFQSGSDGTIISSSQTLSDETGSYSAGLGLSLDTGSKEFSFKNAQSLADSNTVKWNSSLGQVESSIINDDSTQIVVNGKTNIIGDLYQSGSKVNLHVAWPPTGSEEHLLLTDGYIVNGKSYEYSAIAMDHFEEFPGYFHNSFRIYTQDSAAFNYGSYLNVGPIRTGMFLKPSGSSELANMSIQDREDGTSLALMYASELQLGAFNGELITIGNDNCSSSLSGSVYINRDLHLEGEVYDSLDSPGVDGYVLTSTVSGSLWSLPIDTTGSVNDATITLSASNGVVGGGTFTTDQATPDTISFELTPGVISGSDQVDLSLAFGTASQALTASHALNLKEGVDIVINSGSFNYITATSASFGFINFVTGSATVIGDAFVVVNSNSPTLRYSGLATYDSGSTNVTASFFFDSITNDWNYEYDNSGTVDYGVAMFGPEYTVQGTPVYNTVNTLVKADGGHHLLDSNITDTGTLISLGSNTEVVGSVSASTYYGDGSNLTGITSTDITELNSKSGSWDTAFGWGDHSTEGYLTSFTETDPIFTAHTASSITGTQISNWDTAFGWGDHSLAGYLTSYSETDTLQTVTTRGSSTTTTITAANFITTSDKRLKSEIKPIQEGLEVIKKFVSYEYIKDGVQDAGFIAQEVQEAIPYSVQEGDKGYLTMNDRPVLAHMHKAILEIEARLSAIEEKLG